ncbi:MAG: YciI family protein [Gemmatimonadota bacterium]
MTDFLLVYKGGDPHFMENLTPEQMQETMQQWEAWFQELESSGNLRNPGSALAPGGAVVSTNGQSIATDSAMAEVKELIGGFSIIAADSLEAAAELAKGSPHLAAPGSTIDVRAIIQM